MSLSEQKRQRELAFQAASKKQQASFDRAQYVAKTKAANKINIGKKARATSMMASAVLPDTSSPQNFVTSLIPGGKIVNKLAKGNKVVNSAYKGNENVNKVSSFVENARRPRA
jgi:hypothetical protein